MTNQQPAPRHMTLDLPDGVTVHPIGLELPHDLRFNDWRRVGEALEHVGAALQWALGDWLASGERYRREYHQAMQEIDRRYQTLADLKYVSSRVELSRRRESLSHAHHREVASLDPFWQNTWLDDALRQNWTSKELRAEIQAWKNHGKEPAIAYVKLQIKADEQRAAAWRAAAQRAGLQTDQWAIATLDQAATTQTAA